MDGDLAYAGNGDLAYDGAAQPGHADMSHAGNGDLAHDGAAQPGPVPPAGPSAAFSYTPASPSAQDMVTFDASASQPGPGEAISGYDWLFNNSVTRSGAVVTWRLPSGSGAYDATLTVTDTGGQAGRTTQVITT